MKVEVTLQGGLGSDARRTSFGSGRCASTTLTVFSGRFDWARCRDRIDGAPHAHNTIGILRCSVFVGRPVRTRRHFGGVLRFTLYNSKWTRSFFAASESPQVFLRPHGLCLPRFHSPMHNKIYVGTIPPEPPKGGYLFVHDEVPDIPRARVFDPTIHSFNPLQGLNYRKANELVEIFDALFSRGDSTLTKDTGLDFIAEALDGTPASLDTLIERPDKQSSPGHQWAYGKVRRLMRSPVLSRMLCTPTNFSFNPRSTILARVNRAELGDFDALAVGLFLMAHYKGQVVVPDFGFYGREAHISLLRENRLIAGVRFLAELPEALRHSVLFIEDKEVGGALYDDAVLLAKHAGLRPDPSRDQNPFNEFIDAAMQRDV